MTKSMTGLFALFLGISCLGAPKELLNPSFEEGKHTPADWQTKGVVALDSKVKIAGEKSLRMDRDATTLPETRAKSAKFAVTNKVCNISGAMKTELYAQDVSFNATLNLIFFNAEGKKLEHKTVIYLCGKNPWKIFNEKIPCPEQAKNAELVLSIFKTYGSVWLDNLKLAFIDKSFDIAHKTVFKSDNLGFMFYPEEKVKITMDVSTDTPLPDSAMNFDWQLTDYWGELQLPPQKGTLTKKGKNKYQAELDLSQFQLEMGPYYEIRTSMPLGKGKSLNDKMSFAILPKAETFKYDPMVIPFGAHTWNCTVKAYFPLSARLGLRRCKVFWMFPEKAPYEPDYDEGYNYKSRIGWAKENGMLPLAGLYPVMHNERKSPQPYSEEALRTGVRKSIEKYADQGLWGFQMGNEPPHWNQEMVKKDVETYRIVYEEIKKVNPKIIAVGTSCGPSETFFKAGFQKYLDVYDIHAYSDLGTLRANMKRYQELFKKYGGKKPIWSTEIGSKSQGLTRHEIAKDLVKKAICFFADDGEYFTWFATGGMPDPEGKKTGTYSDSMDLFGRKYDMHLPRLDAVAYYHVINTMLDKKFVREITDPSGISAFLFRDKKGECMAVLWNVKKPRDIFLPLAGVNDYQIKYLDGRTSKGNAKGNGLNLRITEDPMIIVFNGSEDVIKTINTKPTVKITSLPTNLIPGTTAKISLRKPNTNKAKVQLTAPEGFKVSQMNHPRKDLAEDIVFEILPPESCRAQAVTLNISQAAGSNSPAAELAFRIPVKNAISFALNPTPLPDGQPAVEFAVTNNSKKTEDIQYQIDIVDEIPMEGGTFPLTKAQAPNAFFTKASKDDLKLQAGETKKILLPLGNTDPMTIYRVKTSIIDSAGTTSSSTRLFGGFAKVAKTNTPINIDGNLDEPSWKQTISYDINKERQVFVVYKEKYQWTGPDNLSGKMKLLWDKDNLYVGVEVKDDIYINPRKDSQMWNQDGLQFLFDPYRKEEEKKGRYDYSMGVGRKGPQAWCHLSADAKTPVGLVEDIKLAMRRTDEKTGNVVYEVAIPWKLIAPFKPAPGANLGMSMIINEDDGPGRSSFIGWFSGVHLKEVNLVGDLILMK